MDSREPRTAALDAAWRELELDALASEGPIRDADVKNAIRRNRLRVEEAAARAALEQVAALREQVAHYTAGCWCLNRPWCVPHGWAGTDPDVERGICADHDHFASPAPSPARDTSAPERGARSAPRRRRTPAYSRTTRAAAAERDALKEAYEAYRRHEATPSEQTYWRALDEAIRALLADPAPSPAREPVDMERLAGLLHKTGYVCGDDHDDDRNGWQRRCLMLAQEVARLSDNP